MTGTEARGATQLPLSSVERLDCGSAPGPKALKEGVKDPAHHVVSLNSSDGLIMLYGHPVVSKIALQASVPCSDCGIVVEQRMESIDDFTHSAVQLCPTCWNAYRQRSVFAGGCCG